MQSFDDLTTCGWRSSTLSLKIKLDLYTSLVVFTAIYASESWKSTTRIRQQLDVFHQRNLWKILGITWKDHVTTGGAKPDWAAKITGHCSRETTSDDRPYYQDATWTTSQSRHVMDPSW